jgi:hypothetical protein
MLRRIGLAAAVAACVASAAGAASGSEVPLHPTFALRPHGVIVTCGDTHPGCTMTLIVTGYHLRGVTVHGRGHISYTFTRAQAHHSLKVRYIARTPEQRVERLVILDSAGRTAR